MRKLIQRLCGCTCDCESGGGAEPPCDKHHFGEWSDIVYGTTFDWEEEEKRYKYEQQTLAVKYDRDRGRGSSKVDKSDPEIVPYSEVATKWCKLSGNKYSVTVAQVKQDRKCMASNCNERQTRYAPHRYVAFYKGEIIAETESRDALDRELLRHNRQS